MGNMVKYCLNLIYVFIILVVFLCEVRSDEDIKIPNTFELIKDPACQKDINKYCKKSFDNFQVLECLQSDKDIMLSLSDECQNAIWHYKLNLTKDIRFDVVVEKACSTDLNDINECSQFKNGQGLLIPCLIENRDLVKDENCNDFLKKISIFVFADYRLSSNFTDKCKDDIAKYQCGRPDNGGLIGKDNLVHHQGKTIECLYQRSISNDGSKPLSVDCEKQMLHLAELQSDDYHMDRSLYYACHNDRQNLCSNIKAGHGKIYRCLFKKKMHPEMSKACKKQIIKRQKLGSKDFKLRYGLAHQCENDIKRLNCINFDKKHHFKQAKLADVMVCLENSTETSEINLQPECLTEILQLKTELMEDYSISPEIVSFCHEAIHHNCSGLQRNGKTLHCLFRNAMLTKDKQRGVSEKCFDALQRLVHIVKPNQDFRIDPLLHEDCHRIAEAFCYKNRDSGNFDDIHIFECLLDKVGSDDMTNPCEERLIELEYFAQRDLRMNPNAFRACKPDMKSVCMIDATESNIETHDSSTNVLACMFQKMIDKKLSVKCSIEIKQIMRHRTVSVHLDPKLEYECMRDLTLTCHKSLRPKEELNCLIDKYDELTSIGCKAGIKEFMDQRAEMPLNLDTILAEACMRMAKQFCGNLVKNGNEVEILQCLIEHKTHDDMDLKCASGIEHHQIVSLKNYTFSAKLKKHCKNSVESICSDGPKTKEKIIHCLSEAIHTDTLTNVKQRVDRLCRKQIKFELLQRSESINVDKPLKLKCKADIEKFCKDIEAGNGRIIKCLKDFRQDLTNECHRVMFKQEREESNVEMIVDFTLFKACKDMIKNYCDDKDAVQIFPCLVQHKEKEDFDENCRKVIFEKEEERSKDIRLQPQLFKSCRREIFNLCGSLIKAVKNDEESGGKIIACLKKQFRMKTSKLSQQCSIQVSKIIKEAALDYKQDPLLVNACKDQIKYFCIDELAGSLDTHGTIVNCLKEQFLKNSLMNYPNKISGKNCIMQLVRILSESQIDVHVDPQLEKACAIDMAHLCSQIPRGEGRLLTCLLNALEDKKVKLQDDCRQKLSDRKQMWELSAQFEPPQNAGEITYLVYQSPMRNKLLFLFFTMLMIIFVGGLYCGRVTKRVHTSMKNK